MFRSVLSFAALPNVGFILFVVFTHPLYVYMTIRRGLAVSVHDLYLESASWMSSIMWFAALSWTLMMAYRSSVHMLDTYPTKARSKHVRTAPISLRCYVNLAEQITQSLCLMPTVSVQGYQALVCFGGKVKQYSLCLPVSNQSRSVGTLYARSMHSTVDVNPGVYTLQCPDRTNVRCLPPTFIPLVWKSFSTHHLPLPPPDDTAIKPYRRCILASSSPSLDSPPTAR